MTTAFCILFVTCMVSVAIYLSYRGIVSYRLFQYDKYNPYRRHCKKCNSHQVMYSSNIEGQEDVHWWAEVYPIGNDENCKCHSFSEYRS